MIRILISSILYLISFFTQAQDNSNQNTLAIHQPKVTITTVVNQISSDRGTLYFGLYDSAEKFANREYIQARSVQANKNGVSVVFDNVPKGEYAISCFYDENDNGKMDFNSNGMPIEDYGSSNNVMSFGPPRFSDAKFVVSDKDLTFEIKL